MWCNRVSACGWRCTSFVFLKRWLYFSFFCPFNVSTVGCHRVTHNVPLLGDVAMPAERVVSAKIELNRENRVEATQNQQ